MQSASLEHHTWAPVRRTIAAFPPEWSLWEWVFITAAIFLPGKSSVTADTMSSPSCGVTPESIIYTDVDVQTTPVALGVLKYPQQAESFT
jgi:hypothetical protein